MKKLLKLFLILVVIMFANPGVYAQGNTTSSISGNVYDKDSQTLPGASILATHTPSGTRYTASTDGTGNFRISNMRVGGPYKIVITFVGFKTFEDSDVYLQLGDSKDFKVVLQEESNELQEVVVRTSRDNTFNSQRTGAQTVINSDKIKALPSLSRNISDFARLTPQAQLRGDDVLSIGGQNNRFNAIYIDGAVSNDVFGLAANGTNGGQTGVSPISIDAIEQFQVSVAPYDVKLSGFAGGAISAITKSGTNNFEGSAYFFNRDENLAGKTPPSLAGTNGRKKLADFSAQTYGVRAGGALIEDKLFYFVNYERQDNETPQPFDLSTYTGLSGSRLGELRTKLATYGYDPGSFENNVRTLVSDKLIGKIDWNINDNHKLSLKHSYVKAENFSPSRSSATAISFINGSQLFNSTTNSTALELNSRFGNKFSNNLVVAYTSVIDDRDASGSPFPTVQIFDGANQSIFFGAEGFSTANLLDQKTLTISDNFEINAGMSKITIGTHNEFSKSRNVFFGNNFGSYRYATLNDFLNNAKPNRFQLNYSLIGGEGDDSQGAAEFGTKQFGFYIQNDMKLNSNLKVSYGIRVDIPVWEDGLGNNDFNNRTIGLLQAAGKNLKGARVGEGIANYTHFAPRFGFNYDLNGKKSTQFRGGLGIFTSRLPLVWPGGTYNNNGVSQGAISITSPTGMPLFNPNPSVASQIAPLPASYPRPGSGRTGGNVDLFAKNFKLPQVFKASFAVDQKLPLGFVLTSEITYNDNISAIIYENLNIKAASSALTGADTRPRYNGNSRVDPSYLGIYLASNTDEGTAYNLAFTLTKNFRSDFIDANISGTYSYGKSTVLMDATSSQNSSQWNNTETVNGANYLALSRSDFDQGRRIISNGNATFKWNKFTKSRIGVFYEGAQGTPISYVYNDSGRLLQDTFSNSALIYVPAAQSEIRLVSTSANTLTPQQQWDALSTFIEGNEYLRGRKGGYAERNGDRLKTSHVVDLKFAQEFTINVGKKKHTLEFTADIFNFTNLLNKNWGKRYFTNFDQVQLLQQVGFLADNTTPTFSYNPAVANSINQADDVGLNSSRWQMQTGVRYTFN
ncbi:MULTISPECIES: carboxypeptidase regulatory-like domain-containing protein [Flavobacterium]|uniref:TonB-dependent receptor n=1 Tax=Flavobacterium ranwuense TaxID=2541725 RepID=A0ABY2DVC8_9FLAO|nr:MULTISPECIES: carboxypeptidase regulatory-like domain-containing protein [Flavobacterium]TDE31671.1 TonB-dependent receptor [Flavobacterium ranwuense]TDE55040.1 TonB-dependent receptor [Flavobacterium sp. GT3P67]